MVTLDNGGLARNDDPVGIGMTQMVNSRNYIHGNRRRCIGTYMLKPPELRHVAHQPPDNRGVFYLLKQLNIQSIMALAETRRSPPHKENQHAHTHTRARAQAQKTVKK